MREKYLFDYLISDKMKVKPTKRRSQYAVKHEPVDLLQSLQQQAAACTRCRLRTKATQVVFGEGPDQADLMFVGEGPGADEDKQGRPFVGAAGKLLDKILAAAEICRDEVYITNVVKCRPPNNRTPASDEIAACLPHLLQQIQLIQPKIIVCLGSLATKTLIDQDARVTAVRGRWFEKYNARIMATFHPAALLRDAAKKRPVWEDIQKIRDAYRSL